MSNNYEPPRTNARASPVTECRREGKNARPTVRVVKSSPREVDKDAATSTAGWKRTRVPSAGEDVYTKEAPRGVTPSPRGKDETILTRQVIVTGARYSKSNPYREKEVTPTKTRKLKDQKTNSEIMPLLSVAVVVPQ